MSTADILRSKRDLAEALRMPTDEELVVREEVVALLFNVSDIAASLAHIEDLLEDDDGEEEVDAG